MGDTTVFTTVLDTPTTPVPATTLTEPTEPSPMPDTPWDTTPTPDMLPTLTELMSSPEKPFPMESPTPPSELSTPVSSGTASTTPERRSLVEYNARKSIM